MENETYIRQMNIDTMMSMKKSFLFFALSHLQKSQQGQLKNLNFKLKPF